MRLLARLVACLAVVGVAGACKSSHNAVRPAASVPAPASGSTTSAPTSSTVSATAVSACATSPATSTTARASTATTTLQHTSTTAGTGTTATVPPNTSTTLAPNTPAPTCYVTRTNVKLRASPSISSTAVGVVPGDTKLQVQCIATGETVDGPAGPDSTWEKVVFGGTAGFVSDQFVDKVGALGALTPPKC